MVRTIASVLLAAALSTFVSHVNADVYMHNPRGNNDRNCEVSRCKMNASSGNAHCVATRPAAAPCFHFFHLQRNVNRNNGNRLFDSQNNAKGGYACPRAVGGPAVETNKMCVAQLLCMRHYILSASQTPHPVSSTGIITLVQWFLWSGLPSTDADPTRKLCVRRNWPSKLLHAKPKRATYVCTRQFWLFCLRYVCFFSQFDFNTWVVWSRSVIFVSVLEICLPCACALKRGSSAVFGAGESCDCWFAWPC